jgi:hypothetical protein
MEQTNRLNGNFRRMRRSISLPSLLITILLAIWAGNLIPAEASTVYQFGWDATANTAPVLQVNLPLRLADVPEDSLSPPGNTLAEILASGGEDVITDADPEAEEGVAVVGVNDTNGVWEYSLNPIPAESFDWQPFGLVSEAEAVLLRDEDWVRFVPAPNFFGLAGSITFRAWDQTTGTAGERGVDTTVNGGSTAFSVNTAPASVTVTPVNDVPILGGLPTEPLLYIEGSAPLVLLGEAFTITDDSQNLVSARVELTNPLDGNAEQLTVAAGESGISASFQAGVLDLVGLAPPGVYQEVMRTILYSNSSRDPNPSDRNLIVTVSDSEGTSLPGFITVKIQPVNNPPELDLDGSGGTGNFQTIYFINRGPALVVGPNLLLSDPDSTTIKSATIRIVNIRNQQAEILNARILGNPNIVRSYDIDTGILTLTGVDSVANYQRVLRTVTYNNALPQPITENRFIEFTVNDGFLDSEVRTTTVSFAEASPVYFFMPIIGRRGEEPNDTCADALGIQVNRAESFLANDRNDWFYFNLTQAANVTIELRDFGPARGQMVVAAGPGCSSLQLVGHNGNNLPNKDVPLGRQQPGRYFIWIINDGAFDTTNPYTLLVRVTP